MEAASFDNPETEKLPCPIPVVCPACRSELEVSGAKIVCSSCGRQYTFCGGHPDLIIGGRFDDPTDEGRMLYEEKANEDTTRNYWIPLLHRLLSDREGTQRILSMGCGTGADVDLLCDAGYDAVGIDCGNRTDVWPRRKKSERLLLANGRHIPFPDATFDAAYCGCVFPHVGVVGDTAQVSDRYHEDRLELAREMTRVLRPGGVIIVSSPNRNFPLDIFHGREEGTYRPRLNVFTDPFLLSIGDYRKLFLEAGCAAARAEPVDGYWGFIRSRHSLKGYLLGLPVRWIFRLISNERLKFLRGSPLAPWIVVTIKKS